MKLKHLTFVAAIGLLVGCVTERTPEERTPYVATLPARQTTEEMTPPPAAVLKSKSDSIPGYIVIKCRVGHPGAKKQFVCGPTNVKITNEVSHAIVEHSFKGERTAIPAEANGSYIVEITTKGCDAKRFQGITNGMGITAQFENCAVK